MYVPCKSGHATHIIKNCVLGEIKRYLKYDSQKNNFLKIRLQFFPGYVIGD